MATKKQIQANRNNARKSTGPRSPEGKARVAQNALKHGLLARDSVLPGEDPAEFDQQFQALEKALQPDNALEFEFLRQIVDAQWRMRRLVRLETGFLAAALEEARTASGGSGNGGGGDSQQVPGVETNDSPANGDPSHKQAQEQSGGCTPATSLPAESHHTDTLLLGKALLNRTFALHQLARYDAQLSRRFHRALDKLIELRHAEHRTRERQDTFGPGWPTTSPAGIPPSPGSKPYTEISFGAGPLDPPRNDGGFALQAKPAKQSQSPASGLESIGYRHPSKSLGGRSCLHEAMSKPATASPNRLRAATVKERVKLRHSVALPPR